MRNVNICIQEKGMNFSPVKIGKNLNTIVSNIY